MLRPSRLAAVIDSGSPLTVARPSRNLTEFPSPNDRLDVTQKTLADLAQPVESDPRRNRSSPLGSIRRDASDDPGADVRVADSFQRQARARGVSARSARGVVDALRSTNIYWLNRTARILYLEYPGSASNRNGLRYKGVCDDVPSSDLRV
jgi:hypothetical protein